MGLWGMAQFLFIVLKAPEQHAWCWYSQSQDANQ